MEEQNKKVRNNKPLIIISIVAGICVVAGIILAIFMGGASGKVQQIMKPIQKTIYEAKSVDLGQPNDDVGVMILSCDTKDDLSDARNISVSNRVGKYVEGTGAFTNASFDVVIAQGVFRNMVDISDYKSVHISIYINDATKLEDAIWLELTSGVIYDEDEISWLIPPSKFKNGWNDFYLSIDGAYITGNPDLETLFYFRMFSVGLQYGTTIIYDNIYATNTEGVIYQPEARVQRVEPDEYEETASTEGKMLMSCNTVNIFETLSFVEVTTDKGEFVEGTGAYKLVGGVESPRAYGQFAKPADISAYKDGYLHLSLYVNDVNLLTDRINFELTSAGTYDTDEKQWLIEYSMLKSGWNEFWLPMGDTSDIGNIDLSKINYFRIFTENPKEGFQIILDNVHVTMEGARDAYKETKADVGKMITSCNTINTFTKLFNAEVTTEKGQFVEGTGALKSTNKTSSLIEANFKKPVDISAYTEGYMHLSVYINDVAYLGDLLILELTSSGTFDKDEFHFDIAVDGLTNGWNDIVIPMSRGGYVENPDLSKINYLRIYTTTDEEYAKRVFIADDIRVLSASEGYVNEETSAPNGQMIASCNTVDIFKELAWVEVTKASRQYVEGTGALKTNGFSEVLFYGVLNNPVNISKYGKGYLHMSFFIDDVTKLAGDMAIELSSAGTPDVDEYQWNVSKAILSNGWNELWLPYNDSTTTVIGKPDLSKIQRIRVYTIGQKEGMVTIFDNIYATNEKTVGNACACGRPIYAGDILTGNCLCYFEERFNLQLATEHVEGDFALQAKNAQAGMFGKFAKSVNMKDYKNGYIHLSLYIDDVSKLKNNISFELSSSGTHDKNELDWEIKKKSLKNGWNEIWLNVEDAAVTGTVKYRALNYFRLYSAKCDEDMILILDNVYVSKTK